MTLHLPVQQTLRTDQDFKDAVELLRYVYKHREPDALLVFSVNTPFRAKSIEQNNKFHAWMQQIADITGNDAADVKEFVMSENGAGFLTDKVVKSFGKEVTVRTSFADLDKDQTVMLMNRVQVWAADDLGINLE